MQGWNVIFLLDNTPPTKILMLQRANNKRFAPGMYTGIGGKIEPGETFLDSAYRELQEETGLTNVTLKQFAKVFIDDTEQLIYFWGVFQDPLPPSEDGELEWVSTTEVLNKNIIPTTFEMLKQWQSQDFSLTQFELHVKTISEENGIKQVRVTSNLTLRLRSV
jgi:8-oxo-dGTP pyrophosphatase MutT (NUDIX family)